MTSPDTAAKRPPWTRWQKVIAVLFVAAVSLQFAVPSLVVISGGNSDSEYAYRFGWQMYRADLNMRYWATTVDGRTRRLDAVAEAGTFWGNVHYGSVTPQRLCEADPRRVTITRYNLTPRGRHEAEANYSCR
jgi:hypothetical protein